MVTGAAQLPLFGPAGGEQRWDRGRDAWVLPGRDHFQPGRYAVAPISEAAARAFVERHHYSGSYPAARLRYGLLEDGQLAGVAVLSVPVNERTLTRPFPGLQPYTQTLELGRFVLADSVGFNGESWFLARAFRLAAGDGLRGVVSFSDPVPRTTTAGLIVFPGHVGGIYQASSATYAGRGTARTLTLLPDGTVLSARALQKVRAGETGTDYVERLLVDHGARPRGGRPGPAWLAEALDDARARELRHPGNHRYLFRLGTPAERRAIQLGLVAEPYPRAA